MDEGGELSISIWLQWLEGEDRGDLSALFLDRYDLKKSSTKVRGVLCVVCTCLRGRWNVRALSKRRSSTKLLESTGCVCLAHTWIRSTDHVSCSIHLSLPTSQVWKPADTWPRELIILDPRPITPHYPLCSPQPTQGREPCNNSATRKSATAQDPALNGRRVSSGVQVDEPSRPCCSPTADVQRWLLFRITVCDLLRWRVEGRWQWGSRGWSNVSEDEKVWGPSNFHFQKIQHVAKYDICHW